MIKGGRMVANSDIKDVQTDVRTILISVGKIEQHLKDMNGKLRRHEVDIKSLWKCNTDQEVKLGKIFAVGTLGGLIAGALVAIVGALI